MSRSFSRNAPILPSNLSRFGIVRSKSTVANAPQSMPPVSSKSGRML
jgi:hypothetical protein